VEFEFGGLSGLLASPDSTDEIIDENGRRKPHKSMSSKGCYYREGEPRLNTELGTQGSEFPIRPTKYGLKKCRSWFRSDLAHHVQTRLGQTWGF
jgi:hypothetical protein